MKRFHSLFSTFHLDFDRRPPYYNGTKAKGEDEKYEREAEVFHSRMLAGFTVRGTVCRVLLSDEPDAVADAVADRDVFEEDRSIRVEGVGVREGGEGRETWSGVAKRP